MSNDEYTPITSALGRIVSGNPYFGKTKDLDGNQMIYKTGPKAGQQRYSYDIGLAVPKLDAATGQWNPALLEMFALIHTKGQALYPQLFDAQGQPNATFSGKYTDGDSTVQNREGRAPADDPNKHGMFVFWFSNSTPPTVWSSDGKTKILEDNHVKCGDWVIISGSVAPNGSKQNPGVFLNMSHVIHMFVGEEIKHGPNIGAIAQAAAAQAAPAGTVAANYTPGAVPAQAAPVPAQAAPAQAAPAPTQAAPAQAAPAPAYQPPAPAQAAPAQAAPAPDQAFATPPAPAPVQAAPAPAPVQAAPAPAPVQAAPAPAPGGIPAYQPQ